MATLTAELPDLYEVIDGEIVECPPMSVEAQTCAFDLAYHLTNHGLSKKIGQAYTEVLVQMPDPINRDRRPDVIFVSFKSWPQGKRKPADRSWDITPELCVEVVSPSDQADDLREKIIEYFEAGIPQVWVVYPQQEVVDIYDSPESSRTLTRKGTLTGGTIIPGFSLPLDQLFGPPAN